MYKLFQKCILAFLFFVPALACANSLESYHFDDTFFSGSYSPEQYQVSDLFFNVAGNSFGGKIFFQDLTIVDLTQLEIVDGSQRYCSKQVRGFYVNSARGNRVRPLDQDSLAYLQTVDSGYNDIVMTGGFFLCSNPSNGVVGYIQHVRKGEIYSLIAGLELDFLANDYLPFYAGDGNFLFENDITTGYLWDSYGGIAQIIGSGLNVQYVCGNDVVEDNELCDDGQNNGTVLGGCNITCNGYLATICGNGTIEHGEVCDDGSGVNGTAGHCNLACNGIITVSSPGGGGGGGAIFVKDICNQDRDCSDSYYDKICGPCSPIKKIVDTLFHDPTEEKVAASIVGSSFSQEINEAYLRAYTMGITTMPTIQQVNITGTLLRKHAAKMISQFALNVLEKKPNESMLCVFSDINNENPDMQYYARLACKLGIMGLTSDGIPATKFTPNGEVTRAQFGTMLSRLLYGDQYNTATGLRYQAHLDALKTAGIMTKITKPMMLELRGWVMVMLQRIGK